MTLFVTNPAVRNQRIPAAHSTRTRGVVAPLDGSRYMARFRSRITQPGYRKGEPSPNRGKKFYSDTLKREEVFALIEANNCGATGLRDRAIVGMLYGSGARIGEVCGLQVPDVDLEGAAVRIRGTKTKHADRTVGIPPTVAAMVRDWLDVRADLGIARGYGPVFCCVSKHERGNQIKPTQVRQKLKMLAEKAGIEKRVHPHCLRHTLASELAREGVDLRLIQRALGHSNIAVTHIYLNHIAPFEVVQAMSARTWGAAG